MKIIENFRTFLWSLRMLKIARKVQRNRQMIGLDLAKNVGIYFYYDGKESYETANKFANFLRQRGISAMLLAYCDAKEKPLEESPSFGVFVKSQLGFDRIPHDDVVNMFLKQRFDIFFDLSLTNHFHNLYIANASHATFKVGRATEEGLKIFDFTLEVEEPATMAHFIDTILKYFEIFNQSETVINFKDI
jgi:hypothetical protein